jgi:hypothetical protein
LADFLLREELAARPRTKYNIAKRLTIFLRL